MHGSFCRVSCTHFHILYRAQCYSAGISIHLGRYVEVHSIARLLHVMTSVQIMYGCFLSVSCTRTFVIYIDPVLTFVSFYRRVECNSDW